MLILFADSAFYSYSLSPRQKMVFYLTMQGSVIEWRILMEGHNVSYFMV